MFGFWRAKPVKTSKVRLIIDYSPDTGVEVFANWPAPRNDDDKIAVMRDLGGIIGMLCEGELLPAIQQAVALAGQRLDCHDVARGTLMVAQEYLAVRRDVKEETENVSKEPVVSATQTFSVRYRPDGSATL